MAEVILSLPLPDLDGPRQPGVTDPRWPDRPPTAIADPTDYERFYAGQLERQRHLYILTLDVRASRREELATLLMALTRFAKREMTKPAVSSNRPFDPSRPNRRVTVTIGFGVTLFTTLEGDDRYGLAALKPRSLRLLPRVVGDQGCAPRDRVADLIVLIASDDVYVNEFIAAWICNGNVDPHLHVRDLERGYSRPDSREPSGFEDGLTNPRGPAIVPLVYVGADDDEPDWCVDGTYLAYRKISRNLKPFFQRSEKEQEAIFGVEKESGQRLPGAAVSSHALKMNPRRGDHRDLLGLRDDQRQILRRPYFFNDGVGPRGVVQNGLLHLSFARRLGIQYEWPLLMWQTNPDFPTKGVGLDALYTAGGATNIGGGYYFIPAAAVGDSYVGARLLEGER